MEAIANLVLLFFFYACLGWCIEVTAKLIQYRRFINRGFCAGPICPIYGFGAVLITLAAGALSPLESGVGTTFALSLLLCGALEYGTSYWMEKRFHARWWDYSQKPMNLHGRVWIGNLVLFGLGGAAVVHLINPALRPVLEGLTPAVREAAAALLLAVFAADYAMSHFVMKLIKTGVESSTADSTEAVNREIRLMLQNRNVFYRRLADAYPDVIYRTDRIRNRLEQLKNETERLRREAEQRLAGQKMQLISSVEPSTMVKSAIIDKQSRLIALLYDESAATAEMKALKAEIDGEQRRLQARPLARIESRLGGRAD